MIRKKLKQVSNVLNYKSKRVSLKLGRLLKRKEMSQTYVKGYLTCQEVSHRNYKGSQVSQNDYKYVRRVEKS